MRLTTRAVAAAVGVSDATIRRWSQMGLLPPYEVRNEGKRGRTGIFPEGTIEQARWVQGKLNNHASWDEIRASLEAGEFSHFPGDK